MSAVTPSEIASIRGSDVATRRKRKALACNNCRRQKLRCDRATPVCGRCSVASSAESCTYEKSVPYSAHQRSNVQTLNPNGEKTTHMENRLQPTPTPQSSRTLNQVSTTQENSSSRGSVALVHSEVRRDRMSQVEQSRSSSPETLENRQPSAFWRPQAQLITLPRAAHQPSKQKPEPMIFRGRNFATQYFGATHPISLIARFPELQTFMVEAISQDATLAQVQRSLKSLQSQWKHRRPLPLEVGIIDLGHLLRLLPDQQIADQLIHTYWATFETMYRILYGPRFWANYQALWERPTEASADFVVIVLLAMASVSCIMPQDRPKYIGDSSSPRERAAAWIDICESWLGLQSQKNITLSYWQSHCLLLLAKLSHTIKKKRSWTSAGALMRLAMSAGFHRDPDLLRRPMTQLEKELRRRLWATMLELELQVSIDRGLPSSVPNVQWDARNVLNVNDEDLKEIGSEAQAFTLNAYTSTSFLYMSRESLHLRSSLNTLINNSENLMTPEDIIKYDQQLTQSLEQIETFNSSCVANSSHKVSELPVALLDIQLRQFLIILHAPFAIEPDSSTLYSSSRLACFNAAVAILDQYNRLSVIECNALSLLRDDTLRSALVTCHVIEVTRNLTNERLLIKMGDGLHHYIDTALERLGQNITLLGTGYTYYWYLSAACGLLKSTVPPAKVREEQRIAVDRVIRQYYKVLASQEDLTTYTATEVYRRLYGVENSNSTVLCQPEDALHTSMSTSNIPMSQMSFDLEPPNAQLEEFFFGDPAAWTFENIW